MYVRTTWITLTLINIVEYRVLMIIIITEPFTMGKGHYNKICFVKSTD